MTSSSAAGQSSSAHQQSGSSSSSSTVAASAGTVIEQDTYAILQANIPFTDIVRHVLTKLSYTPQEMVGAKGKSNCFFIFIFQLMQRQQWQL